MALPFLIQRNGFCLLMNVDLVVVNKNRPETSKAIVHSYSVYIYHDSVKYHGRILKAKIRVKTRKKREAELSELSKKNTNETTSAQKYLQVCIERDMRPWIHWKCSASNRIDKLW